MNIEDFTPEQIERARACKTQEELLELVKEEGVELTAEQLEQVSGGDMWDFMDGASRSFGLNCPKCSSNAFLLREQDGKTVYQCKYCGAVYINDGSGRVLYQK